MWRDFLIHTLESETQSRALQSLNRNGLRAALCAILVVLLNDFFQIGGQSEAFVTAMATLLMTGVLALYEMYLFITAESRKVLRDSVLDFFGGWFGAMTATHWLFDNTVVTLVFLTLAVGLPIVRAKVVYDEFGDN